jgi:hypothetical protein
MEERSHEWKSAGKESRWRCRQPRASAWIQQDTRCPTRTHGSDTWCFRQDSVVLRACGFVRLEVRTTRAGAACVGRRCCVVYMVVADRAARLVPRRWPRVCTRNATSQETARMCANLGTARDRMWTLRAWPATGYQRGGTTVRAYHGSTCLHPPASLSAATRHEWRGANRANQRRAVWTDMARDTGDVRASGPWTHAHILARHTTPHRSLPPTHTQRQPWARPARFFSNEASVRVHWPSTATQRELYTRNTRHPTRIHLCVHEPLGLHRTQRPCPHAFPARVRSLRGTTA